MKILVHHIFYRPEPIGNGTYTGEMCEWLAKTATPLRVVCPPPYYPFLERSSRLTAPWTYRSEVIVRCSPSFRCPIWVPAKSRGVRRLLYVASFAISSFPSHARRNFSVGLTSSSGHRAFICERDLFSALGEAAAGAASPGFMCRILSRPRIRSPTVSAAPFSVRLVSGRRDPG